MIEHESSSGKALEKSLKFTCNRNQNLKRTMNCSCRGRPVPVFGDAALSLLLLKFTVVLIIPKLPGAVRFVGPVPGA